MEILGTGPALNFNGGSSGGVITPNLVLSGLSRSLGPVAGDLDNILGGNFDPTSVFSGALDATILGGVKLIDLIKAVTDFSGDSPPTTGDADRLQHRELGAGRRADERRRPNERGADHARRSRRAGRRTFTGSPDIVDNNPIVSAITDSTATPSFDARRRA